MEVVDLDTSEQLGRIANLSVSSGVNSPYPTDTTAPVPSTTITVAGDDVHDLMYHSGNRGALRNGTSLPFTGVIGNTESSGDSGLGSISVDHVSSRLNQEITTRPIMSSGFDGGDGKRIIQGTLRHWASECGLFEDGVDGHVLMGFSNNVPGVGYYSHPSKRMLGVGFDPSANVNQWVPTESATVDPGFGLRLGQSLRFVIGFNEQVPVTLATVTAKVTMSAGQVYSIGEESEGGATTLIIDYKQNTNYVTIRETQGTRTATVFNVLLPKPYRLIAVDLTLTRTTNNNVKYDLSMLSEDGLPHTNSITVVNSLMPDSIAVDNCVLTHKDYLEGFRTFEGVGSLYIIRGGKPLTITDWYTNGVQFNFVWPGKDVWKNSAIPGVTGTAWELINDLATTYGLLFDPLRFTLLPPETIVGMPKQIQGVLTRGSGVRVQSNARERAETVEVVNYNYKSSQDVFDSVRLYEEETVYSLAAGERQEHIVQTEGSFSRLDQPTCVSALTAAKYIKNKNYGESIYSVYDSANREVTPNEWNKSGGSIVVSGTGVLGEIKIEIQAPTQSLTAATPPFTISLETSIPSLVIAGIGMKPDKKTLTVYTGAGSGIDIKKVGITYDNPLVAAEWIAWNVGAGLGALYGTSYTTASGTFPLLGYFGTVQPIRRKGSYYLPLSISNSASTVNVSTATRYNSCNAIVSEYSGKTCAEVNTLFAGKNVRYVNMSPLPQIMD